MCGLHYQRWYRSTPKEERGEWVKTYKPRPDKAKWLNADGSRMECLVETCEKDAYYHGMCRMHDSRVKRNGTAELVRSRTNEDGTWKECSVSTCDKPVLASGLCTSHYQRNAKGVDVENIPDRYDICPVFECGRRKVPSSEICKRCNQFRWRYSLTVEQVIRFWLPENRVCSNSGCRSVERLHMDHDHSCCGAQSHPQSNKVSCGECVRGWLCHPCNTSLGQLQENPQIIRGLLEFLEESSKSIHDAME